MAKLSADQFIEKKRSRRLGALASVFILLLAPLGNSAAAASSQGTARLLVQFKDSRQPLEAELRPGESLAQGLARYRLKPEVRWAEAETSYRASLIPSDSYYKEQWYLQKIKAPSAWDQERTSAGIVIAIIDSGVDIDHPDLKNNAWRNLDEIPGNRKDDDNNGFIDDIYGWDFVDRTPDPRPKFQSGFTADVLHGTIVAGLAGAEGNNAAGVAGVTWRTQLMPLRVLNDRGEGTAGDVIRAIDYAVNNGAHIINLSFIGFDYSQGLDEAIKRAYDAGVVVVAAAGNEAADRSADINLDAKPMYPVCLDGRPGENRVIGVAATDAMDQKTAFSGYGSRCVDLTAPGVSVFALSVYAPDKKLNDQALDKYYDGYWSGTSVATPLVSGALSLIMAANPGLDRRQAVAALLNSADNLNRLNPKFQGQLGRGRLNVAGAVLAAKASLSSGPRGLLLAPASGTSTAIALTESSGRLLKDLAALAASSSQTALAAGDLNGDGADEIVTAGGSGTKPLIRIYGQSGELLRQFMAYKDSFRGGVSLAVGDTDGDGLAEIVTGAGPGGGPHVRIFSGQAKLRGQFMAYKDSFRGGVSLAVGDIDGGTVNRRAEIVVAPGPGLPPQIRVFSDHGRLVGSFLAYIETFDKGVFVATGDTDGDGLAEIVTGAGSGGGPHVRIFEPSGALEESFYAFAPDSRDGVRPAVIRLP